MSGKGKPPARTPANAKKNKRRNPSPRTRYGKLLNQLFAGDDDKGAVPTEEVREFLQCAARHHRNYYQYTTFDCLTKMLKSGRLYLTLAADLNDRIECLVPKGGRTDSDGSASLPERTYMACFGYGGLESMEMWWMYGFNGSPDRGAVRLAFDGKVLRQWAESFRWPDKRKRETDEFADGIAADRKSEPGPLCFSQMESSSFHDVLYRRKPRKQVDAGKVRGAVLWGDRSAPLSRISGIGTGSDGLFRKLPGFVKDAAWSGERETRLVVTLKEKAKNVRCLSVPFASVLGSLSEILLGPTETEEEMNERKLCTLCRLDRAVLFEDLKHKFDWESLVRCSENPVRFKK